MIKKYDFVIVLSDIRYPSGTDSSFPFSKGAFYLTGKSCCAWMQSGNTDIFGKSIAFERLAVSFYTDLVPFLSVRTNDTLEDIDGCALR